MPGTVTLSHQGVCAGSRPSLTVATPRSGGRGAASEPGRGDHLVRLERELALPRRPADADPVPAVVPLDALDRGVDDVAPRAAAHVLVERWRYRSLSGENASTAVSTGRGDASTIGRAREEALRDLEARVPLADDEHAPTFVLLGEIVST